MKGPYSMDQFLGACHSIVEYQREHNNFIELKLPVMNGSHYLILNGELVLVNKTPRLMLIYHIIRMT